MKRHVLRCASLVLLLIACATPARAQGEESGRGTTEPAFSIASSRTFMTADDQPFIHLTFQQISFLDFRVYRVKDPIKFFSNLRDPHQLGSPEPVVPQERTWLERLAAWKAERREDARNFVRRQFSTMYRAKRRERIDAQEVQQRRTVRYTSFTSMPLLNASQVVATWREMLPPVQYAEARRIPLETHGPGVYLVEAVYPPHRAYTIVVISDVGLVTKTAPGQMLLFAAHRADGNPAANCQVRTVAAGKVLAAGTTSSTGTFEARLTESPENLLAVAQCGNQVAVSDPGGWYLSGAPRVLVGYVYPDRPIYRPGHTVHLKAVLRWRTRGALVPFDRSDAEVVIMDPSNKVLYRERRPVDEFGSVHTSFTVPATAALGVYSVQVNTGERPAAGDREDEDAGADQAHGSFEVQEYRKPEFDVAVRFDRRFAVQGTSATATVSARYYFGQPVARAKVRYRLLESPYYSPHRWSSDADESDYGWYGGGDEAEMQTTELDANGNATIEVELAPSDEARDYSVRLEALVADPTGRDVTGEASINATYGSFLLSVTTDRYVYRNASRAALTVRAVDYEGRPQPNVPVNVWLETLEYESGNYSSPTATKTTESMIRTDAAGIATWTTNLPREGTDFRFRASAPSNGRTVQGSANVWVPEYRQDTDGEVDDYTYDRYLELMADKASYQPGEVAHLLVKGEEFDAPVLVTKEAQHVSFYTVVKARSNQTIEVPIGDEDVGDTYVNIAFLMKDRLYRAEKRLRIPAVRRGVQVSVDAAQAVAKPRDPALFTIRTVDHSGAPVRAQVSVGVVDEAVYGVKEDDTPDPLRFFYRREYSRVGTQFSRDYTFVGYSGRQQLLLTQRRRPLTLADFKSDRPQRPAVRKDFPDAIYWVADLVTDGNGTATVKVQYPDALTTWRLTARAVTRDTRVGAAIGRTVVTKDLILRLATPRFLTEQDELHLPVVVHNYLPDTRDVNLTVTAAGVEPVASQGPRVVPVASNGEQRAEWRFRAASAGTATFTGHATTTDDGDALELKIPVLPFGVQRTASSSGSMRGEANRTVELTVPEPSNPAARSIEVRMAPTLAGAVFGALDFLTSYPYGCTEQTLSSFLPNVLVSRTLQQLSLKATERLTALDRQVTQGLNRLYDYQHDDGGWGWWPTDENHPFMTAYALYGLMEVDGAGYQVDRSRIGRGAIRLAALYKEYRAAVPELKTYMLYVLKRTTAVGVAEEAFDEADFKMADAVEEVWDARDHMSSYGKALLVLTLDLFKDQRANDAARTLLGEVKTQGELSWWSNEDDPLLGDWADTSAEATSFAVRALATRERDNPVLERAVRWMLANRDSGYYWSSTKQTAFALYGLLDYMKARSEKPANGEVDVFVNGNLAATHRIDEKAWLAPDEIVVTAPAKSASNQVQLVTRGAAPLYWSATARYYSTGGAMEGTGSRKLAIARQYFSLERRENKGRVTYAERPFTGNAAPGDRLLVRVTVAGAHDWRYLVIEDPLPAGAEAVAEDQDNFQFERRVRFFSGNRREFRDNRVVFFLDDLEGGKTEFTYMLRVVTPGSFRAMPARVMPMYVPGVMASTAEQPFTIAPSGAPTATPVGRP